VSDAARGEPIETELKGLRYAVAGSTGGEFGREIIQHKPAAHLDVHGLAGPMELPDKGAAADGIREQKAFVPHEVARVPRPTAPGQIGGRRSAPCEWRAGPNPGRMGGGALPALCLSPLPSPGARKGAGFPRLCARQRRTTAIGPKGDRKLV
jgi:hypothetical protein